MLASTLLAQQLRQLEADGLVSRTVYPQVPPKVDYRLTAGARPRGHALDALLQWARQGAR